MAPMDHQALFSSPLSTFWSSCAENNNILPVKSEGIYSNNSSSNGGSLCMDSLMQQQEEVVNPPKYSISPFLSTTSSETMVLPDLDQGKCFTTVTSTRRDDYLNIAEVWRTQSTREPVNYSVWNNSETATTATTFASEVEICSNDGSSQRGVVSRCDVDISDDSSLDGGLPASSTVSSGNDGGMEDEFDDDVVGLNSIDLSSMRDFSLSSPRLLHRNNVVPPVSTTQTTEQARTTLLGPLDLRSSWGLEAGASAGEQDRLLQDLKSKQENNWCKGSKALQDLKHNDTPSLDLKSKHEAPSLDVNDNWCKKIKASPPSSPDGSVGPALLPSISKLLPPISAPFPSSSNAFHVQLGSPVPDSSKIGAGAVSPNNNIMANISQAIRFRSSFPALMADNVVPERPKRRNVRISNDPQSVAARHRREKISDRIRLLQSLVPGGFKMDTASMLDEAISYVKYLQDQVRTLEALNNAGFDPRMTFAPMQMRGPIVPFRPGQGSDCSTMSQIAAPGHVLDQGMYGVGQSAMKFPNVPLEQYCH